MATFHLCCKEHLQFNLPCLDPCTCKKQTCGYTLFMVMCKIVMVTCKKQNCNPFFNGCM